VALAFPKLFHAKLIKRNWGWRNLTYPVQP